MKKCKIYHFYLKKIKEFNFIIHINIIHIIISSNFCKKLKERYICDKHFPIPISDYTKLENILYSSYFSIIFNLKG
ncbi:hypothetical protein PFTANZ_01344 [Plasmodium falciparum Tanzania (2000708)]|uniref:Uncharacterized protein n=1 Tax=Plasmodium falciparum Tanzania (2000708) TaxID=1036725 RepID=A0A024WBJ4_PLAFA|nr:hypothetical protein PFTANZ_01344 [Plasmodium falciparum Tanzania (2000708)]